MKKMNETPIDYAREKNLIAQSKVCSCGHDMALQKYGKAKLDGFCWRCCRCKKITSLRSGTFFEHAKVTISTLLQIIYDFVTQTPVTGSANAIGISEKTCIQWYQYCRDICSSKMLKDWEKLGGPGHVVEIDESLLFKRKYNIGRVTNQIWVVGFYDRTQRKGFLRRISDRSARTLEQVIVECVAVGSTIYTDQWRSYSNLGNLGYVHGTVNHSEHFVDPVTEVCTNSIEGYWSRIKRRIKYIYGSSGDMKWSHVDEAMYREAYHMTADKGMENFETFLQHVSEIYRT